MDIQSPPPTTPTTIKTLDRDHRIQPTTTVKDVPPQLTNGVLKRLKPRLHYMNPVVTYRECLKNHAATMGGHAVDGCGEFMPSLTSSPSNPTSLKCAACGCHRNFHRRDPDGLFPNNPGPPVQQHVIEYQPYHRHHPPPPPPQPMSLAGAGEISISPPDSPSPPPISSSYYPSAPHMLLALSSGLSAPPENAQYSPIPIAGGLIGSHSNSAGKKRFRTKFTQEQKEKMHELAERVGWKMQKKDEELIIGFCNEIRVDKGVFKVWMHNNKMTFGSKKDSDNHHIGNGSSVGGNGVDFFLNRNNNQQQQQQQQKDSDNHHNDSISSGGGNANGSSSSS